MVPGPKDACLAVPLAVLMLVGAPADAAPACDFASAPAVLAESARDWIDAAPAALRDSLGDRGVAFAGGRISKDAIGALCRGVTPAVVVFDHPPERVFDLLIQTERQGEFMRDLGAAVPVSRAPAEHVDRHELEILFTHITYYVRHHWNAKARRIWWDLAPTRDNDLDQITGYWELYPLGEDRSLGFYGTAVDIGAAIPKRFQATITRRKMRSAVARIREWIAQEGEMKR